MRLIYPCFAYKLEKTRDITTIEVMDGRKKVVLKKEEKTDALLLSNDAKMSAINVVKGTVPSVKIMVFSNAFQNNESLNIEK
jgi:hypothetical protein